MASNRRHLRDVARLLLLVVAALLLTWADKGLAVAAYSAGFILVLSGVAHFARRVLFPDVDLRDFADMAKTTPVGSAIVFFAVCYVLAALINAGTVMLK